jgi:lauroyl/myristoyl acyltransferase
MYEIFHCAARIVPKLPRWLRQAIAVIIGIMAWILARRQRAHVTANVAQVLGQVLGPSARQSLAGRIRAQFVVCRIFCHCMENYIELLAVSALSTTELLATLDFPKGLENVQEALSHGRGAIVCSAHLGPFAYLPPLFSAFGLDMVVPVENLKDKRMLQLMLKLRSREGIELVPLDGAQAMLTILTALRRNKVVAIVADRVVMGGSVAVDFFGAPARLPTGPIELSLRSGAPLVGGFAWRIPGGRVTGEFTPLTLALPADQRDKPKALQAELARQLERAVGAHLDEWVVFEPIWAGADKRN